MAGGAALLTIALRPRLRLGWRHVVVGTVFALALLALRDAARFYALVGRKTIHAGVPLPLSLPLAALLMRVAWGGRRMPDSPRRTDERRERIVALAMAGGAFIAAPLLAMLFFGTTDYRRSADLAVVFGARAYSDGRPSDALADRVRTACDLYHAGLVPTLLFSGGPGDGDVDEAEAMRRFARDCDVPDSAIILDHAGLTTRATVRNACSVARSINADRVIAVSHGYHLPRVKLSFQREGVEVYTVPATQRRTLRATPFLVAREVAAAWAYYFRVG
jgi:uncharacterized SAM-binding protein YcdF (DUF218 family)